jgi:hypothetical protein
MGGNDAEKNRQTTDYYKAEQGKAKRAERGVWGISKLICNKVAKEEENRFVECDLAHVMGGVQYVFSSWAFLVMVVDDDRGSCLFPISFEKRIIDRCS